MILSIITPSYNQGHFLTETIESVLSQAGEFHIDYIIMDGGSTDISVEIIRHYEGLLQRGEWPTACQGITYRWTSARDNGQTAALAKGFRMANGAIFAWLNSDDTYLPGSLQAAADHFREHPETGLLYGDADYCDQAGAIIGRYRTEEFEFDKLAWYNFICQPSTFFAKETFQTVGGLDEALHFPMDYDLWIRIGRRYPCYYLPQTLSTYRLHETSKTISDQTLIRNCEEALSVAIRHFCWAPLNRVYTACHLRCRAKLPGMLGRSKSIVTVTAMVSSIFRYLYVNRGVHRNDLKLLTRENFRKLSKSRLEIMTGK